MLERILSIETPPAPKSFEELYDVIQHFSKVKGIVSSKIFQVLLLDSPWMGQLITLSLSLPQCT
jgi:hypothetical protein